MPIRTDSDAVKGLLLRDYDLNRVPDLTPFIATASVLVNKVVACRAQKGLPAEDSETLELLERWLAAHYYKQSDKPYASKATAGASGTYQGKTDMKLLSTFYGQTALTLDDSGCLESITEGRVVSLSWLGKPPSEEIEYDQRN